MSYYTDVSFVLTKEANVKFEEVISQHPDTQEFLKEFSPNSIDVKSGDVLYYFNGVNKWHNKEAAEPIRNFLRELHEDEFYYIEVGENIKDFERDGNYIDNPFNLRLTVDIDFDSIQKL